ncbi:MAG TPA: response regulator transcription factor [bacterium]|nr:response regulator transcription factor [bacterium]HMW36699.1 response regulator transcription factor [bacterium]HMY36260.1 response regulator transcription factor [bacterium]HMZ03491.1 response regulator transcription factor [bacterium]HNB09869.1 response regulator transcription factor [bacterium]
MIKVAVVEDDKIIRQSLQIIIDGTDGFRCIGAYPNAESFIDDVQRLKPEVVLMDIHLKNSMSGIEATRILRKAYSRLVILIQTVYEDDNTIFDALCAGANGYLLKKTSPARLIDSIREAVEGGAPMSPAIAKKVVAHFQQNNIVSQNSEDARLSDRELDVLRLIADGRPYKQASELLSVSVPTIRFHMGNIYKKLHATSQSEAIAKAIRRGLI